MPDIADDAAAKPEPAVTTHLGWAVASAMLCFLPLGLVAVAYAVSAHNAVARGESERAVRQARRAKRWLIATVVVGILLDLFLVAVFLLLGAFST